MINEVFAAAQSGDVAKLKMLLESDPSLASCENSDGLTPLGFAAHFGHADAVQLLLDFGAEVNAVSHSKIDFIPSNTALHAAIAGERNMEVIKLLLQHQANANSMDSNGHTCLHTAAFHDDNIEMIQLLIEKGADVRVTTESGADATSIAIERGNFHVAELLKSLT